MKKIILFSIILSFVTNIMFSATPVRLLRIHQPPVKVKGGSNVLLHMADIITILEDPELDLGDGETQIRLYSPQGEKLAKLGLVNKKGRIKWLCKKVKKRFLCVKLKSPHGENLLREVKRKARETRYKLVLTRVQKNSDRLLEVKRYKLAFTEYLDLSALLIYPLAVAPGDKLGARVRLEVINEGNIPARDFFVELVLSKDDQFPFKPAQSSKHFQEDMLLKDGRIMISEVKPGRSIILNFNGPLTIPKDTPYGRYYLGAILDPERKVDELNKKNNVLSRFIFITKDPEKFISGVNSKPVDITKKTTEAPKNKKKG